jgi:hypothetical protein
VSGSGSGIHPPIFIPAPDISKLHAPAVIPLGNEPPVDVEYETGWAPGKTWMLSGRENIVPLLGTETASVI